MTLAELHETLLSWASADPQDPLLLAARKDHFDRYGEPHEEDLSFERRMSGMLEAYLFDCDGTIADSMPLHYLAWTEALAEWNIPLDEARAIAECVEVDIVEAVRLLEIGCPGRVVLPLLV